MARYITIVYDTSSSIYRGIFAVYDALGNVYYLGPGYYPAVRILVANNQFILIALGYETICPFLVSFHVWVDQVHILYEGNFINPCLSYMYLRNITNNLFYRSDYRISVANVYVYYNSSITVSFLR